MELAGGQIKRALAFGRGIVEPAKPPERAAIGVAVGQAETVAGIFVPINLHAQSELSHVADAVGALRGGFGTGERWKEHRG